MYKATYTNTAVATTILAAVLWVSGTHDSDVALLWAQEIQQFGDV
jgi:hypothetical protein